MSHAQRASEHEKYLRVRRFARHVHRGETRGSGKPYMSHPLDVLKVFKKFYTYDGREVGWKQAAVVIAHDTIEHGGSLLELRKIAGSKVARHIEALSYDPKIDRSTRQGRNEALADTVRRIKAEPKWVHLVKLCDAYCNAKPSEMKPTWNFADCARFESEKRYLLDELGGPWPRMAEVLEGRLFTFRATYHKKFNVVDAQLGVCV